ncbi:MULTISPECIES: hypothetical protein [Halorussus]|uniref:hypothetical protein n=1 Tax=Halorussus TaxID=1070314 RepID=UPI000E21AF62|nr:MULTISPECIES: hypothetical protein [Halorussus]NHN60582.1 hypothetical protein [Halorussus sp. JP-T4]
MSTETPERAHDAEPTPDRQSLDSEDNYRTSDGEDGADPDDELVVAVYPRRVHEQVRSDLDDRRERPCREYEAEYADLLAERARLIDEVAALERQLERAESRLDAVVERYERILAARDGSDRDRPGGAWRTGRAGRDGGEDPDDREPTGLLARFGRSLR